MAKQRRSKTFHHHLQFFLIKNLLTSPLIFNSHLIRQTTYQLTSCLLSCLCSHFPLSSFFPLLLSTFFPSALTTRMQVCAKCQEYTLPGQSICLECVGTDLIKSFPVLLDLQSYSLTATQEVYLTQGIALELELQQRLGTECGLDLSGMIDAYIKQMKDQARNDTKEANKSLEPQVQDPETRDAALAQRKTNISDLEVTLSSLDKTKEKMHSIRSNRNSVAHGDAFKSLLTP